ncbi:MAG TPA: efflux RND transporter periplasmic adaptor subunit [Kiloniellales bacterium]|nr:efflux RND transporter periplasmic adaptor subunit [Kiloniellales bacterium]
MRQRGGFPTLLLTTAALIMVFLIGACSEAETDEGDSAQERATPVTVETAQSEQVETVERSLGRLRALNDTTVSAEVEGRLVEVSVNEGDAVEQGDTLATIDPLDFELQLSQARAEISQLKAEIETKEAEVERQRQLREGGHVSQAVLEQSESDLVSLEQQLIMARAQLASAQLNRDRSTIVAPISGRIGTRFVNEGEYMNSGQEMFRIVHEEALEVELAFPERLAGKLETGQLVRLQATEADGEMVETEIKAILPTIGRDNSAVVALAKVHNPGNWRPGGSVHAEVVLEVRDSIVVPVQGVVLRPEGEVVFVEEDGRASERSVEVGRRTADWVEIRAGIEPGERIIVDGAGFLAEGVLVEAEVRETVGHAPVAPETEADTDQPEGEEEEG